MRQGKCLPVFAFLIMKLPLIRRRSATPSPRGEGLEEGKSARKARNRKQAAPLDLQKFLPKYSENQKWATHKMLRPSSPRFAQSFPPGGSLFHRHKIKFQMIVFQSVTKRAMPAPGESLFHRHKIKFQMIVFQSVTKRAMPAPGGSLGNRHKLKITRGR